MSDSRDSHDPLPEDALSQKATRTRKDLERYRCLFDLTPDAVFLEDLDGSILECNAAALKMFGYPKGEMLALKVRDLLPDDVAKTFPAEMSEENTTGGVFVWMSSKRKDGSIFPAQYSNRIVNLDGKKMIYACVRDVSEHYWRKHYARLGGGWGDVGHDAELLPIMNLTWERRGNEFILIGHDAKAEGITRGRIIDFMGTTAARVYADRPDILEDFERCYRDRTIIRRKTLYRMFTIKEERIIELTYAFVPPNMVIMHMEDVTERDAAEVLYQILASSAPVGISIVQDGSFKFVNPKMIEYTGYTVEELSRMNPGDLIYAADRPQIEELEASYRKRERVQGPIRIRMTRKDGAVRWVMVSLTSIFFLKKQAALINFMDITEQKEANERLEELARLHASILEAIPHAVIGLDNRRIVFANHAVEAVFGWKSQDLIGRSMRILFHSDEEYALEGSHFYSELKQKRTHSLEFTYRRRDGRDVVCLTSVSRIGNGDEDRRIVATHTDISAIREAERSLKESQRMLATLMGNLPGMAYRCQNNPDWTMEFVSEGSFELTGYRPDDLIGNRKIAYGKLIHPDDRAFVWDEIQKAVRAHEHFQINYRILSPLHKLRWVWEKGMGVFSPAGELIALEGFITDVTERMMAQRELEESQQQLSIHAEHLHTLLEGERTEIAREVHDELGQVLTALKMDLHWLDKRLPEDSEGMHTKARAMIDLVDSSISTVQRITVELRPSEWQVEEFQNRSGILCEAILDPEPATGTIDKKIATGVFRICQEALTNVARHAGATRVEVVLKLRREYVELLVRDNGRGIRKSEISHSKSFGIIGIRERSHLLGGQMRIHGRKNKGTSLRVIIPIPDVAPTRGAQA